AAYVAPRTETEAALAAIWQDVLGLDRVGVNDNFFEIGGDSILSLQIVARARKVGIAITPKQIFEAPQIERLAGLAGMPKTETRQEVEGELPLTPIQHWFFEHNPLGTPHWNQSVLLKVKRALDPIALESALQALILRHDALRLSFTKACDEDWHQWLFSHDAAPLVDVIDLTGEADWRAALSRGVDRLQSGLDLQLSQLVKAGYFRLPDGSDRLLLVIHHLAVDGVSWRILLEELQAAYEQAERGATIELPLRSTPWSVWTRDLMDYAAKTDLAAELEEWKTRLSNASADLPVSEKGNRRFAASRSVGMELDRETTRRLLQEVPRAYRMR
ncbi:condensation domain-containing protein, partial [Neorhizobium sp. DT-125]|uniref:condensation domain-containing protein n=1 Tax=Neorhizobium sp. DT-125 TaxID=3396163 RepID=UPI003F1A6011